MTVNPASSSTLPMCAPCSARYAVLCFKYIASNGALPGISSNVTCVCASISPGITHSFERSTTCASLGTTTPRANRGDLAVLHKYHLVLADRALRRIDQVPRANCNCLRGSGQRKEKECKDQFFHTLSQKLMRKRTGSQLRTLQECNDISAEWQERQDSDSRRAANSFQ